MVVRYKHSPLTTTHTHTFNDIHNLTEVGHARLRTSCQHRNKGQSRPVERSQDQHPTTVHTDQCNLHRNQRASSPVAASGSRSVAVHFFLPALFPSPFFGVPFPLSFLRRRISSLKSSCSSLKRMRDLIRHSFYFCHTYMHFILWISLFFI